VDVPMDIFSRQIDGSTRVQVRRPGYGRVHGDPQGIEAAAQLFMSAERPVIFAGNGVLLSEACDELRELAELTGSPVATTLMGKGAFPETHALALGTTGIWGTRAANLTTREADVILAIGTAFGEADCSSWNEKFTFAIPPSKLIQIDIDPQEIGKIYPVEIGIVGDAKATLRDLICCIKKGRFQIRENGLRRLELENRKQSWIQELSSDQLDDTKPIHPARLLYELSKAAPSDAVFVTDVGWNKNGAGQQLQCSKPGSFITSGGLATMGFAPAAAIGAKLGNPNRKVVCLVGDGGLTSVLGSLATAVELDVPVLWVVFNNFCFSTIRMVGATYFHNKYGTEFTRPDGTPYNPDFTLIAKAFGIDAELVEEPDLLADAIGRAMKAEGPFLLEVRTKGDIPMPRTGYWDIADFLRLGND